MITAFTQDIITERLYLRRMRKEDWRHLSTILQDAKAMYAYEHAFSDDEVTAWLEKGGTHHEVIVPGRWEARIRLLCRILGIEFTPV